MTTAPATIEGWAKLARRQFHLELGQNWDADREPSARELAAWITVVDLLDELS